MPIGHQEPRFADDHPYDIDAPGPERHAECPSRSPAGPAQTPAARKSHAGQQQRQPAEKAREQGDQPLLHERRAHFLLERVDVEHRHGRINCGDLSRMR